MTNAEIAAALVISEPTVKTHVSGVLQKLGSAAVSLVGCDPCRWLQDALLFCPWPAHD